MKLRWILTGIIILGIGAAVAAFQLRGDSEPSFRTATVTRGNVTSDVSFTGRLVPQRSANVGFAAGGVIRSIAVSVGETVQEGQLLASVDPQTAALDVARAAADLASTKEQTRIAWDKSKTDYEKIAAENAQLIEEQKQRVRDAKLELDQALSAYQTRADDEGEDSYLAKVAYSSYLTARSAYNAAQEALTRLQKTTDKANSSAKTTADLAEEQHLATIQAAGNADGLSSLGALAQRSRVILSQHTLRAPFNGTITRLEGEVGEYASPGTSAITLETTQQLQVKSDVTETDAVKITPGMTATISFDAITGQTWSGHVVSIAPSANIIEGVPTYEVTIQIDSTNQELRSGLTADITVHAKEEQNTLYIPRRAVIDHDGKSFVRIPTNEGAREQEVETGLVGSDGNIEVVSGLTEGEVIVLSTRDE